MYIELHAASAFSFLEGASLPETLVERAASLGYPALALLDRDGVSGLPRFHMAARRAGLKAIVGAELSIRPDPRSPTPDPRSPDPRIWPLPVLVASREGYRNLCRLITRMKLGAPKGEGTLALEELEGSTTGLVALVGRAALAGKLYGVGGLLDRVVGLFGRDNVRVELQRHLLREEESDNQALIALASAFRVPVIATNGVRFAAEIDRPLFDVVTCIRHKTTIARAGLRLAWNAERYLKAPADMSRLFDDLPQAVSATRDLADRLEYTMADLGYRFPDYPVPAGETQASFLRKITEVGARERYRPYHDRARAQVARELDLIEKLDLAGYFLIVWDIVNFCRQHGILVQGRGSAANSAVCYSLGITAVDPVGMELLFERFLSEERGEWPDIDLDLPSGDRREQVIQYVYQRYGKHGAAMTANVITYRSRSAAREVGKVLGLDQAMVDRMAKAMTPFEWKDPHETMARHLSENGLDAGDPVVRHFADLWGRIQDLPRHLGQHSGGMVVCQGRLDEIVPLEPATMPGRVVIQWDKEDCADLGLVKVDLLGLGMMSVLQDALTVVNQQLSAVSSQPLTPDPPPPTPHPLSLSSMPPNDPIVYRMLQEADTIGVFQVESRAQMATLPRLRPDHFYDLVVEVALIRPGPIVGQMVHPYLKRRSGREDVTYPHPLLEPILKRTLGVPLFQEQLLRMAMTVAGFTGGEAEELRRAMGFKRSEARMRQIEGKLRAGMARNGITGETADGIVTSITSFALYGFPESHAASFALLVYASAYLKAHYPAAFYAALLDNQPMGFYHPATIVKDAQRHGVRFLPIDVQVSDWACRVEEDGSIRLGLRYVRGLREEVGRSIVGISAGGGGWGIGDRGKSGGAGHAGGAGYAGGAGHAGGAGYAGGAGLQPCADPPASCPKCGTADPSMIEMLDDGASRRGFCNICAHTWLFPVPDPPSPIPHPPLSPPIPHPRSPTPRSQRFHSLDHLITATRLRRDELATLAEIGALNSFGYDRRSALWQIERAVRPAGELFDESFRSPIPDPPTPVLPSMTPIERAVADYAGTGLTIGPHPMALRRHELALRGILRAVDLPAAHAGRRVRVAGAVITRQRPGTAKGFVFLTLEDETGIANVIVRPDVFTDQRLVIVHEPYVIVEGVLQQQDNVTSVKAERVLPLARRGPDVESHDFH